MSQQFPTSAINTLGGGTNNSQTQSTCACGPNMHSLRLLLEEERSKNQYLEKQNERLKHENNLMSTSAPAAGTAGNSTVFPSKAPQPAAPAPIARSSKQYIVEEMKKIRNAANGLIKQIGQIHEIVEQRVRAREDLGDEEAETEFEENYEQIIYDLESVKDTIESTFDLAERQEYQHRGPVNVLGYQPQPYQQQSQSIPVAPLNPIEAELVRRILSRYANNPAVQGVRVFIRQVSPDLVFEETITHPDGSCNVFNWRPDGLPWNGLSVAVENEAVAIYAHPSNQLLRKYTTGSEIINWV